MMDTSSFLRRYFAPEILAAADESRETVGDYLKRLDTSLPFFRAFNRFLGQKERFVEDEKLVIVEEAQVCCFWGIDPGAISSPDAVIYSAENGDGGLHWEIADRSFHDFLKSMLFWQAVNGGWAISGSVKLGKRKAKMLRGEVHMLELDPRDTGIELFELSPSAIGVIDVSGEVFCAARSDADWEILLRVVPELSIIE
jgi:hypothetical protein